MLESLIKAINTSNNVTLPNFGGIMKMGSSYMFNEFLKFNDGKLSKFLQETEGLSKEDADIEIDNFINEIKSSLTATGSFSLNKIGVLTQIAGKIKLEKPSLTNKSEDKPAPEKSKSKFIAVDVTKENVEKKEIDKQTTKEKPTKKPIDNFSIDFTVKEVQIKIKSSKDKQEIIRFTRGDKRKSIIEALNKKLKSLNNIDIGESDILKVSKIKSNKLKDASIKKVAKEEEEEVKKQVAKESDILKTIIEKEIVDNTIPGTEQVILSATKKVLDQKNAEPSIKKKDVENTENKEEEDLTALKEGAGKLEKEAKRRKRNKIIVWVSLICILSGSSMIGYIKQDVIFSWFNVSAELSQKEPTEKIENSDIDKSTNEEAGTTLKKEVKEISELEIIHEEIEILEGENEILEEKNEILESAEAEEVLVRETIIEPEEIIQVENAIQGNYYIVVGSFSQEKNATNLLQSLKKEGYPDAIIFQNGNLRSVSLALFSTSAEAKKVLKQSGRNGWVKKSKKNLN